MDTTIRSATPEDKKQIDALIKLIMGIDYENKFYDYILKDGIAINYVLCTNDNKIIGYVLAAYLQDNVNRFTGVIISIGVHEKYRRKGYGTKLLQTAEQDLIRYPIHCISLHTSKYNKPGYKFFCKHSYNRAKKVKNYYRKGVDAYLMKKIMSDHM